MVERDEFFQVRSQKLDRLRQQGIDPYPARFRRSHTILKALDLLSRREARSVTTGRRSISITGRVTGIRNMGKATFLDIRDGTGQIQGHLQRDVLGKNYDLLKELDLGDFLGIRGKLIRTRRGEPSVAALSITLLGKALRPPPEKWHGLQDVQQRFRQREVDLLSNQEVRDRFILRSKVVEGIRRFLSNHDFIEVETPILLGVAAGGVAKPFVTQHNALSRTLYLRIATELHLKRCIIGGLDRVFEIGRIFRNEGLDARHNPEFTTLESYQAYADYNEVMEMVETMVSTVATDLLGTTKIQIGSTNIDLKPPWKRLSLREAIITEIGLDIEEYLDAKSLALQMRERGVVVTQEDSWGRLVDKLLGDKIEPNLVQPTFLIDYPVEMTPLAKRIPSKPRYVERFEAFIHGMEIANAYSELNDPVEQRHRFEEQEELRNLHSSEDFDRLDEEFLTAIEYGMPPTGGLGMGIDRLMMLLSGQSAIREVILFPHMSWSQEDIFREVDRRVQEIRAEDVSITPERLFIRVKSQLPDEVRSRIAEGELRSRIELRN
ncbi:MAG: lysine--tRNA ligase [Chloroflexota bacterium]|nr:lysine--tRNA ligase [Chloroflexota bacterium]